VVAPWFKRISALRSLLIICSTASVPLVHVFVSQGMNIGAGMVLLLAGPVTSWGTILVLRKEFGGKTLFIYLVVMTAKIIVVCKSREKGTKKEPVADGILREDYGLIGDAHADCCPHRQVSLLAIESIGKMRSLSFDVGPGDFADMPDEKMLPR